MYNFKPTTLDGLPAVTGLVAVVGNLLSTGEDDEADVVGRIGAAVGVAVDGDDGIGVGVTAGVGSAGVGVGVLSTVAGLSSTSFFPAASFFVPVVVKVLMVSFIRFPPTTAYKRAL